MGEALQKVGWDAGTKSKEGPAIKAQRFTKVKREVSIAFCTVAGTRTFILCFIHIDNLIKIVVSYSHESCNIFRFKVRHGHNEEGC